MKIKKGYTVLLTTALALIPPYFALKAHKRPLDKVRFCLPLTPTAALPVLADKLGYFNQQELQPEIEFEETGKTCLEGLIARKFDFAVAGTSPAVNAITMANPLIVISELQNCSHLSALVYHHSKANSGDGFAGGRIAIISGTDGELLLRLYAKEHPPMRLSQFKMQKTKAYKSATDLLRRGRVDGAVLREPELSNFLRSFPEHEFNSDQPELFTSFSLLLSYGEMARTRPALIGKVVHALALAQKYIENHPEQARETALAAMQIEDTDSMRALWPKIHFGIGLSSLLLSTMQQAELALVSKQDLTLAETGNINIFQSLFPQALRNLNPDLVTYE